MVSAVSSFFSGDAAEYESSVLLLVNAGKATLEAVQQQGLRLQRAIPLSKLKMTITPVSIPRGEDVSTVLDKLKQQGIKQIMLNHFYQLEGQKIQMHVTPDYPNTLINWSIPCKNCGIGIKIGLVDSYVDAQTDALKNQQITRRSFAEGAETSNLDHGTAIATLLVGCHDKKFCGLMPDAVLYAAGAFSDAESSNPRATILAIAKAMDWLMTEKVDVINLSFSGPDNELLKIAIQQISKKRIPVIAAAGNHGKDADPVYPAAYPGVIAVTAVDQFNRLYNRANQGRYISFAAPGVQVPVPCSGQDICLKSGTSFAAPYCTALVASNLRRGKKKRSIKTIINRLRKNSVDLGPVGRDGAYGWGLVQCGKQCGSRNR
jgi:transcription initiation factor TFIIIB Brf1 subunit/transcription initiation factor TFIIB